MNGWTFLRFIYALRQAGLPVSSQDINETLCCLERYPELPVYLILKNLLVHRPQDLPIFQLAWQTLNTPTTNDIVNSDCASKEELKLGSGGLGIGQGSGGSQITSELTIQSLNKIFKFIPSLPQTLSQDLIFDETVKKMLGEIDYYAWINSVDLAFQKGQITEEEWYENRQQSEKIKRDISLHLLNLQIKEQNSWEPLKRLYWRYKPLQSLTGNEKRLVQNALKQWAKKIAVRPGWRTRKNTHGKLDFPGTIHNALQKNGLIFHLYYKKPVPKVPDLIILCDVSNSVTPYVEFLLFLVAQLKFCFRKIRIFFFIDSIWEVTENIWDNFEEIKQEIESWGRKLSSGFSDYGKVMQEFTKQILDQISSRSTIVILGDGKNNFRAPRTEYIAEISSQVRHVMWLNPLNVEEWSERDNILPNYRQYCTKIYRCRTADDLQVIARKLL